VIVDRRSSSHLEIDVEVEMRPLAGQHNPLPKDVNSRTGGLEVVATKVQKALKEQLLTSSYKDHGRGKLSQNLSLERAFFLSKRESSMTFVGGDIPVHVVGMEFSLCCFPDDQVHYVGIFWPG
jgi:hypothetical protein